MSFQTNLTEVMAIAHELNDVLDHVHGRYPEKTITATSGREYKVVNVLENLLIPTSLVSRGMFCCEICGTADEPKHFDEDSWTRFTYGDNKVHLHIGDIHLLKQHPEAAFEYDLGYDKLRAVFLS